MSELLEMIASTAGVILALWGYTQMNDYAMGAALIIWFMLLVHWSIPKKK